MTGEELVAIAKLTKPSERRTAKSKLAEKDPVMYEIYNSSWYLKKITKAAKLEEDTI